MPKDDPTSPDPAAILAAAQAAATTATEAAAAAAGHADRAEAAASAPVAGAPAPKAPYIGAIVHVRTSEAIDGQNTHAGIVTFCDGTRINAALFRAIDPLPLMRHDLEFDDGPPDAGTCWCWPELPA